MQNLLVCAIVSGHHNAVSKVGKTLKNMKPTLPIRMTPTYDDSFNDQLDFLGRDISQFEEVLIHRDLYLSYSPLMMALEEERTDIAMELINLEVSMAFTGKNGLTALHIACKNGMKDIVLHILRTAKTQKRFCQEGEGCSSDCELIVDARDHQGWTALMYAAKGDHLEIIKELILKYKARCDIQNELGQNLYHIAQLESLKYLCSMPKNDSHSFLRIKDQNDRTPLLLALRDSNVEIVEYLADMSTAEDLANITDYSNQQNTSSLHLAAEINAVHLAKQLIKSGCIMDAKNTDGNTALHIAYMRSHRSIIDLIESSCKAKRINLEAENFQNKGGKLPREVAVVVKDVMVPPEIEKLGEKAVEIYYQALHEGKQRIPYCSLLILGREEVGKTSLYRQLVGMHYLEKMDSTRGIDNNEVDTVDSRHVHINEDTHWQEKNSSTTERFPLALLSDFNDKRHKKQAPTVSEAHILAELEEITKSLDLIQTTQKASQASQPSQATPNNLSLSDVPNFAQVIEENMQAVSAASIESDYSQIPMDSEESAVSVISLYQNDAIANKSGILSSEQCSMIDELVKSGMQPIETTLILNTLDFAGQKGYRPMHHCFILRRALYLVVFKIPDMLEFIHSPTEAKYNPLDDICYWIQSIKAHICPSPEEASNEGELEIKKVLLVGTHRGNYDEALKEVDDYIKNSLLLEKDSFYYDIIQSLGTSSKLAFFAAVENSIDIRTGSDSYLQKSGTKQVQVAIKEMSQKLPFLNEYYPIKWLKFEECLKHMYLANKSSPILTVKDLKDLAIKLFITDEAQQAIALKFFHEAGKIIYLKHLSSLFLNDDDHKKLVDLIVLHPQWLMSMMKVIMELTMANNEIKLKRSQIQSLEMDGVADMIVFNECWKKFLPVSQPFITIDHICLILQAYCLIYPLQSEKRSKDRKYIIPCKLPDNLKDKENRRLKEIKRQCATFYFNFHQFLPNEIFFRLICLLITQSQPAKGCHNFYSKKICFFRNLQETNWIVEHEEDHKRIKVMVLMKQNQTPTDLLHYIGFIHEKCLCKICNESGLRGLVYEGGKEIECVCKKQMILPYFSYDNGVEKKCESYSCQDCYKQYDLLDPDSLLSGGDGNLDLKEVCDLLWEARSKWCALGLQLNITQSTLDVIQMQVGGPDDHFRKMLSTWLRTFPQATYKDIIKALSHPTVGFNTLASELGKKYN